jgi:TonB family protein
LRALILAFLVCCSCGHQSRVQIKQIAAPDYPLEARFGRIQGTVKVDVSIGADGRVTEAHGSGADPVLVRAAEQNATQWVFGPFPPDYEFPIFHTITYVYRLEGKIYFVVDPPRTKTHLPDRVELIATPLASDNSVILKPAAKPKP